MSGWIASLRVLLRKSPNKDFLWNTRRFRQLVAAFISGSGLEYACVNCVRVTVDIITHLTHAHSVSHYLWWRQQQAAETSGISKKIFGWWFPQENPERSIILGAQGKDGTGLPITQLEACRKHRDTRRRQSAILTYATVRETVANAVGPSAHCSSALCVMELRNPIARDWSGSSLAS